ncbi:MAG: DEAD/DEAH box helicase [Bowdeniella nasicola]|nr:DEAD/DEAH box helicase [Bowdeniella nasicola]
MHPIVELFTNLATDGQITHIATSAPTPARLASWPAAIHRRVLRAYAAAGIDTLWSHQDAALRAIAAGRTTVIATGTGSGKSLPPWATLLSAVETWHDARQGQAAGKISTDLRRPTLLYVAPTKALGADQVDTLNRMIGAGDLHTQVAALDGDTPTRMRRTIRERANALCTNPDFLHFSLLASHHHYARWFAGLQLIVIDEAHSYRGLFGAHVALVMRRVLRIARHYGANPTIVMLSATSAAPTELATAWFGELAGPIATITEDGSPRGLHHLIWWKPASGSPHDAAALSANLARAHARTLTFVRSRTFAETLAAHVKDLAALPPGTPVTQAHATNPRPLIVTGTPLHHAKIAAYRGGYLPAERRELERQLRAGELAVLTATNALELGIDIAGLDAVVIAGWPGSRASIIQQAGRAGRAGTTGIAIFVARDDPLDQYLVDHPELVAAAGVEHSVIDITNAHVQLAHVCAAASEVPLTRADFPTFALGDDTIVDALVARDVLRYDANGWSYNELLARRAHDLTDLRAGGGHSVDVVHQASGELLGTVSYDRADASVHPGAIYIHQGAHFQITSFDGTCALAEPIAATTIRTVARSHTHLDLGTAPASDTVGVWNGPVTVHSQVVGYDRRDQRTGEIRSSHRLDLPQRSFTSVACLWQLPTQEVVSRGVDDIAGALHAAEHALIALLPLLAGCDRNDIGGISSPMHHHSGGAVIAIYDGAPGGAGFAARGFARRNEWVELTAKRLAACVCQAGCPRCVISPKCGSGNTPLDKAGALVVLDVLTGAARAVA